MSFLAFLPELNHDSLPLLDFERDSELDQQRMSLRKSLLESRLEMVNLRLAQTVVLSSPDRSPSPARYCNRKVLFVDTVSSPDRFQGPAVFVVCRTRNVLGAWLDQSCGILGQYQLLRVLCKDPALLLTRHPTQRCSGV